MIAADMRTIIACKPAARKCMGGNSADEIPDGISSDALVLYRTACQDSTE
jgi:hypothetical protein